MVRHLLGVYEQQVSPVYWLSSIKAQRYQQHMQSGQVDLLQRFQIFILCAISKRLLGQNQPTWLVVARLLL